MKKVFIIFLSMILCISVFITPAIAQDKLTVIKMLSYEMDTEYNENEVMVEYVEDVDKNIYLARVIDIKTQSVLQTYSEKPSIPIAVLKKMYSEPSKLRAQSTYETTWDTNVTLVSSRNQIVQAYTWVRVQITGDFTWRRVDKVLDKGHMSGNSGAYDLMVAGTYVNTTKFPCSTNLAIGINGVTEIKSSHSGGFSIDILKSIGFSVQSTSETNWTARKSYNTQATFRVMPS